MILIMIIFTVENNCDKYYCEFFSGFFYEGSKEHLFEINLFCNIIYIYIYIYIYMYVPVCSCVAQWLEHCVSSAKVVGSIPREHMY